MHTHISSSLNDSGENGAGLGAGVGVNVGVGVGVGVAIDLVSLERCETLPPAWVREGGSMSVDWRHMGV